MDACTTSDCPAGGSGQVAGLYTKADYLAYQNTTELTPSFPLASVSVQASSVDPVRLGPHDALHRPRRALPAPNPSLNGVLNPQTIVLQTPVSSVTAQGVAAGLLGAGFVRVSQRNRPVAVSVAAKSSISGTKAGSGSTPVSHFE